MNPERLLREVEKRLAAVDDAVREQVLAAVRDEIRREHRRAPQFPATVENERERRVEAETLREVLEAINRQARLEETIEEVLKQLAGSSRWTPARSRSWTGPGPSASSPGAASPTAT